MIVQVKQIILFLWIFISPVQSLFSQQFSKNNYTGAWENPTSWSPTWFAPQHYINPDDITINGYITVTGNLTFTGTSNMIINDTLVINGDLSLDNYSDLTINNNAVLIIRGSLYFLDNSNIIANGYLIITGDIHKTGSISAGTIKSNGNPVKIYIGGTIYPVGLSNEKILYPAVNCSSSPTTPYPGTNCSYGNMTDILNDPIYPFFQSGCAISTPTITSSGPITFCQGGSVILTSTQASTFLWSNGATTQAINVTATGSYSVKVINAAGCQSISSSATLVTVNALPATPTIIADGPIAFCNGGNVTLTSTSASTFLWSNGATTQVINVTSTGSYSVKVINAAGCQSVSSASISVTVNALPATPIITADGATTFCTGGSVFLTSTSASTFLWSNTATTQAINVTATGSYSVKVINAAGCQSISSAATVITVNALPATPTITADGATTFCTGGSVFLTSTSASTFLWSNGATTQAINVTSTGNYSVKVINAAGCQSASSAATVVTVNALPATPTITADGPIAFCNGGNVTLTSTSASTFLWSNGATTQAINVTSTGSYSVKVINAAGCQSASLASTMVTVNDLPATPTITVDGPTTFCIGGNVTLTSTSTSTSTSTFLWSNAANTSNITVSEAGNYSVRVTDSNGCQSAVSAPTIITVNTFPSTPTITTDGPLIFCTGGSVPLTSTSASTFLWSNGATTQSINVTATGSYSVMITNAAGCQSASSEATLVRVNDLPAAPSIKANGPTTFCTGSSIILTSTSASAYYWSNGASTRSVTVNETGSYLVRVTNIDGCQSIVSLPFVVSVTEIPVAFAGSDQELENVFETKLEAEMPAFGAGEWSLISGSGQIKDIHSPVTGIIKLPAGETVFLWKVINGICEARDEVKITVYDLVIPSVITPDGDGKNDYFRISGIKGHVDLTIFNRWGNEEYSNSNYSNNWDGRNNKGVPLPNDTYFYILKFESGIIKKGSVLIKR